MKTITKALVGTVAAGAMAMASATPAMARDRDNDGISAGEVIAGAVILGGLAAVIASADNDRDDYRYGNDGYYNRGYPNRGYYNNAGNPRSAVDQCVRAAEQTANRYSYGGRSKVTDIRDIDRKSGGYKVKGRIAVNTRNANWRGGWGNDWRGWNNQYNGYDAGSFTCDVRYGRVTGLDIDGIRGL
jgi:hypothetical protein